MQIISNYYCTCIFSSFLNQQLGLLMCYTSLDLLIHVLIFSLGLLFPTNHDSSERSQKVPWILHKSYGNEVMLTWEWILRPFVKQEIILYSTNWWWKNWIVHLLKYQISSHQSTGQWNMFYLTCTGWSISNFV